MAKKPSQKQTVVSKNVAKPAVKKPVNQTPQKPVSKIKLSLELKLCVLLGIISFLVYSNSISGGYVLDDVMVLKDNKIVRKGISAIWELFSTPHLKGYLNLGNDTYRPLSLVLYAIGFQFFGDNTSFYHFLNVVVFSGCSIFLFLFLNELFEKKRIALAFVATVLFAVHPIHTEVTANIKSMDELLCFFFAFLALLLFMFYRNSGKALHLALGAVSLYLSYISKESVVTFLGLIPLIFFLFFKDERKRAAIITGTATSVAAIFLAIRWAILTQFKANVHSNINFIDNFLVRSPSPMSRLATEILILAKYLKQMVFPYPLICDYSFNSIPYVTFKDISVWISLLVCLGLITLGIVRLIRFKKDPLAFGILYFFITISLFSNIPFLIGSAMAERFMFFPSVGICLVLSWLITNENLLQSLKNIFGNKNNSEGEQPVEKFEVFGTVYSKRTLTILIPVTAILWLLTMDRNKDWSTNYSLYKSDVQKSPENTRLGYNIANEMEKIYEVEPDPAKKQRMIDSSMAYLRKSLQIYPFNTDAHLEIGVDFFHSQKYDSAEWHFKYAIELNPHQSNAMFNLGTIYLRINKFDSAFKYYHKTVEVNPDRYPAIFNEGVCYYNLKKYDSAIYDFKKTIELAPEYNGYKSFGYTAIVYNVIGQKDSSKKYELLAKKYEPNFKMP